MTKALPTPPPLLLPSLHITPLSSLNQHINACKFSPLRAGGPDRCPIVAVSTISAQGTFTNAPSLTTERQKFTADFPVPGKGKVVGILSRQIFRARRRGREGGHAVQRSRKAKMSGSNPNGEPTKYFDRCRFSVVFVGLSMSHLTTSGIGNLWSAGLLQVCAVIDQFKRDNQSINY